METSYHAFRFIFFFKILEKLFPLKKFQEFSTLLNSVEQEFGADRFFHPVHVFRLKNSSYGSFYCYFESASLAQKLNFILSNNIIIICERECHDLSAFVSTFPVL